MKKKYKVVGNTYFNHNFILGTIVELVQIYPDGVYEVSGDYFGNEITQDVHPIDLEEF